MLLFNAHQHLTQHVCSPALASPHHLPTKPGIYQPGSETPSSHPGSAYPATSSSCLWIWTNAKAVNIPRLQASYAPKSHLPTTPPTAAAKPSRRRGTLVPEHAGRGAAALGVGVGGTTTPRPSPRGRVGELFSSVPNRRLFGSNGGSCALGLPLLSLPASPPARRGRGARAPATCATPPEAGRPSAPTRQRQGAAGCAETTPLPGTATLSAPPKTLSLHREHPLAPRQGGSHGLGQPGLRGGGRTPPPARPQPLRRGPGRLAWPPPSPPSAYQRAILLLG